ncbi:MAG: tetratricopeptide repeat protein [Bacillaceae bacterium]|nr:tetratricopeptide repeat protein [Bacillaceae bacterium]
MLIQQVFSIMFEQLDRIKQIYAQADPVTKQECDRQLLELRQMSDTILDQWIEFEEKMAELVDTPPLPALENTASTTLTGHQETPTKSDHQTIELISEEASHHFRRGQGYFDLHMYEQSIPHFIRVIEQEPELNVARLYLALGYFHAQKLDEAQIHLNLLLHTEDHPLLVAFSHNLMGCVFLQKGNTVPAIDHFSQALEIFSDFSDAAFNLGYTLIKQGKYQEAISVLLPVAEDNQYDDWETVSMLSEAYRKLGDEQTADELNQKLLSEHRDPFSMQHLASQYEKNGNHLNATICYARVLEQDPANSEAWHGLGWNTWLHQPSTRGIIYLKKAITLAPLRLDYWFSYGWILYHTGEVEKAETVFHRLLEQEANHVLALAALILINGVKGNLMKAESFCQRLIRHPDPAVQGLGYHHLGRLSIVKGDYAGAVPYFKRSIQLVNDEVKENYLYLGLCNFFQGHKQAAEDNWKKLLPFVYPVSSS